MSSNKDTLIGGVLTGYDVEGTRLQDVQNQISKVASQISQTQTSPVTIPQPGSPFYLGVATTKKGRVRAQFDALLPANTVTLITKIVQTSLRTDATTFNNNIIEDTYTVDPDALAANGYNIGYIFKPFLETLVQYDLVQLIAITGNNRTKNPQTVAFNQVPLAQFTTAKFANGPSPPSLTDVIVNQLDQGTKTHDAEFTLRVYSPLTIANTAQNWPQAFVDGKVHCALIEGTLVTQIKRKILATDLLTDPGSPIVPNRGYVDISKKKVTPGAQIQWTENVLVVSGEPLSSGVNVVGFTAGNLGVSVQNLTGVNLNVQAGPPNDPKHEKMSLEFIQPTPAVALKNVSVNMKIHGTPDTSYVPIVTHHSLRLAEYHTPGPYTVAANTAIVLKQSLKMLPGITYDFQLILKVIGNANYLNIGTGLPPVFTVTAGANPDAPADTAAPSGLSQPGFHFIDKADCKITGMGVTTNFGQPTANAKYVVIYNGNPAQCFDIQTYHDTFNNPGGPTVQFAASEALGRFPIGDKMHDSIHIKLKHLKNLYGPSTIISAYFYAENTLFGISAKSPDSSPSVNLATGLDFLSGGGAPNVLDVSTLVGVSTDNIAFNGDFLYSNGTAGQLGSWFNSPTGSGSVITAGGSPLSWATTGLNGDSVLCVGPVFTVQLSQRLGKWLKPGDYFACSLLVATSTPTSIIITASLVDVLTFAQTATPANLVIPTSSTTYVFYGFQLQFNPAVITGNAQALLFALSVAAPGAALFIDRVMFNRGTQPMIFAPRKLGELNGAATAGTQVWQFTAENPDVTPSSGATAGAGVGSATGVLAAGQPTQGGWQAPGLARQILLTP